VAVNIGHQKFMPTSIEDRVIHEALATVNAMVKVSAALDSDSKWAVFKRCVMRN